MASPGNASPVTSETAEQEQSRKLFKMLNRISDADSSRFYRGTFIMVKPGELSAMRVTHGRDDDGTWESLESLTGESRTVVRQQGKVISVYPSRELVTIRHTDAPDSLHFTLPEDVDKLSRFYSMKQRDDDRVADRPAMVIDLIPDDEYRYGYRYWVDKETGMLLRCDLVDENRTVVEQMMFTSLDYLPVSPDYDFTLNAYQQFRRQQIVDGSSTVDGKLVPEADPWVVSNLPDGFVLAETAMRNAHDAIGGQAEASPDTVDTDEPELLHMVYSDGLASVSVFIENFEGDSNHLLGPASVGAVNAYGNPLGRHYITVVGEVPPKTVKLLAESITRKAQ